MDNQLQMYYFIYSHLQERLDSFIVNTNEVSLNKLQLRCRFNSHRDLKLYAILLKEREAQVLNAEPNNKTLFEHLKELNIAEVGF